MYKFRVLSYNQGRQKLEVNVTYGMHTWIRNWETHSKWKQMDFIYHEKENLALN